MSVAHDPTLIASMAASRETRVAFGVLTLIVVMLLIVGSWSAGAAAATERRFVAIEASLSEDRGRQSIAELDVRDVLTRLTQIETTIGASQRDLERVAADVQAIRDAVAPLPRLKAGE